MRALVVGLWLWTWAPSVYAHPFAPGYMQVDRLGPQRWQVTLRQPRLSVPSELRPTWPNDCDAQRRPAPNGAARWALSCRSPLKFVGAEGFVSPAEEVLVRVVDTSSAGAADHLYRLDEDRPSAPLQVETPSGVEPSTGAAALGSYVGLGIEHIVLGYDHLAFIGLLVLMVPSRLAVVGHLSLFTLAHSITLSLAALGWLTLAPEPVEAIIALSIAFAGREVLRRPAGQAARPRRAVALTFGFGLLHGLGLAGALRETGLPPERALLALLGFNLGVECGQLLGVAVLVAALEAGRRARPSIRRGARWATSYAVGSLAIAWTLARLAALAPGS